MNVRDYDYLIGSKVGKLTVLGLIANQDTSDFPQNWDWLCECECGKTVTRKTKTLRQHNRCSCRDCNERPSFYIMRWK